MATATGLWTICTRSPSLTRLSSQQPRALSSNVDVVTLGNVCLDILVNVPRLPPPSLEYVRSLEASPPDENAWEAGGICNFTIAAARLGLDCVSIGHVGNERFGSFLTGVMQKNGIKFVEISEETGSTLICWVLVDLDHRHSFCSRFDFNKDPVFRAISYAAECEIKRSKVFFVNGFVFDEFSASAVLHAMQCAHKSNVATFFDPGPRGESIMLKDNTTLSKVLSLSKVVLLTSDEAKVLTGFEEPHLAAQALLKTGLHTDCVIVKLGAHGSLMANKDGIQYAPGFKVNVVDTVGCGDSFGAAVALGYIYAQRPLTLLTLANAVGAATAMGCGAGRNVASVQVVYEVLKKSEMTTGFVQDTPQCETDSSREDAISLLDKLLVKLKTNTIC